jgi:alpha-beta hydrolase superfamily lysophospholipase
LCHGFIADALQWYDVAAGTNYIARSAALLGLTCYGVDLDGTTSWGRDGFIDAIDDVIAWGATEYGTRTDKASFYGVSMGCLALNWIAAHPTQLAAAAFTLPVCQLDAIHDRNPGPGIGPAIDAAYGGGAAYEASLLTNPSHDPMLNTTLLAPIADKIRLWYSGDDTTVLPAEVTAFAGATGISAVNVGAVGHTLAWDQQQVLNWLIPRADP